MFKEASGSGYKLVEETMETILEICCFLTHSFSSQRVAPAVISLKRMQAA